MPAAARDDQLLQIIAADLGGMVVLINGYGLRSKPEGDLPVAEDRIIRKVFQRDLVFSAIVPMAHQSDIDIRVSAAPTHPASPQFSMQKARYPQTD